MIQSQSSGKDGCLWMTAVAQHFSHQPAQVMLSPALSFGKFQHFEGVAVQTGVDPLIEKLKGLQCISTKRQKQGEVVPAA